MKVAEVIEFLEDNGLSEIEELKATDNCIIVKFYYDFDKEELSAARAYANEESDLDEDSDEWYRDWYLSYLNDVAKDTVEEVIEELSEEFEVEGKFKAVEMDANNSDYMKFVAMIAMDSEDVDLEDILNDYL
ncbi:hypothetical protein ACQPU1_13595 [Clostridium paraputrificum]|uniref:hypothetical protein n=1 Tax=Clostridium TaxID=1485 RepID=UPI003D333751